MFSLGGLLGGAIGGALSQFKVSALTQNLSLGLIVLICGLGIHSSLLPAAADKHEYLHGKRMRKPLLFWGLGLLGVCATISEGTAGDWGGILARETFHASYFLSTVPFIAFSATMVIGRFSGDLLAEKYGAARLLIAGGILAGTGLSAGLLIGSIYSQIAGWFALGLGISVIIPLIYSAAGSIARNKYDGIIAPSEAVALVSGIAYFSFIAGPPTIGFLSELISLRWALLLPALLAFALSIGSRFAMAD